MAAADPVFEALGLKQVEPTGFSSADLGLQNVAPLPEPQACVSAPMDPMASQNAAAGYNYGAWAPQAQSNPWNTYMQAAAACAAAFQALTFASTSQGGVQQVSPQQAPSLVLPDVLPSDASRSLATSYNPVASYATPTPYSTAPYNSVNTAPTVGFMPDGMSTSPTTPWVPTVPSQSQWQTPATWQTAPPQQPPNVMAPVTTTPAPPMPPVVAAAAESTSNAEGAPLPQGLPLQRIHDDTPGTPSSGGRGCSGDSEKENAPVELNLAERTAPPSPGVLGEQKESTQRKGTPLSLMNSLSPPFSDGPPRTVSLFELTPPPKLRSLADCADVPCFVPSPGWEQAYYHGATPSPEHSAPVPAAASATGTTRSRMLAFRNVTLEERFESDHTIPGKLKAKWMPDAPSSDSAAKREADLKQGAEAGAMLLQLVKGNSKAATTVPATSGAPAVAGKGMSRGEIRAQAAAARETAKTNNTLAMLFAREATPERPAAPVTSRRRRGAAGKRGATYVEEKRSDSPASDSWQYDSEQSNPQDDNRVVPRLRIGKSGQRMVKQW
mmetsp:Transcript_11020/g.25198  ORF Transcript_11020/g.25198 Transcript_11020/m.25198 type:complete len:553 (-) Transcript_11020:60-1718(-)|eukprot:CAMPEP_0178407060 /NCGR_PEP_ID=MMETSP0689_2-20121128/19233_1 /TAXON_ID=160604 /ORGANISM="Amphidinium massartii, Strain CS-259" /LENGTH=552 /DNA_ID=CAMNT_0020028121 /DNA_START=75 /DNA_END=1733 /DNA_ORIENTATION=+